MAPHYIRCPPKIKREYAALPTVETAPAAARKGRRREVAQDGVNSRLTTIIL
jgi:hypothetical protein